MVLLVTMEKFPTHQKESGINRVVGFESDKEQDILQYFKDRFNGNTVDKREKEKTPEQRELIKRVNVEMKDFLNQYGVSAIEISADNVHIIDTTAFTEPELQKIQKQFGKNGFYSASKQGVVIMKEYDASKLAFLQTLVHEMLHLQGFCAYQKSTREAADTSARTSNESVDLNIRRLGFAVGTRDGKTLLFDKVNEAVITELEIRFEHTYITKWPEVEEELRKRDAYVNQIAKRDRRDVETVKKMVAGIQKNESGDYQLVTYPYHQERQQLNQLVDELYKKNSDSFASREQVFHVFAEATMRGALLPVARLIEKSFGKGSFRKLAERSADTLNR